MCGICVCIHKRHSQTDEVVVEDSYLLNRGPDYYGRQAFLDDNVHFSGAIHGCVLALRSCLNPQPINNAGDLLVWNGEIFNGIEVPDTENDGLVLANLLKDAADDSEFLGVFSQIQGPWSFAYWQNNSQTLWFGRDIFGRRSLLWHLPADGNETFALSSVGIKPLKWKEVPANGIYSLQFWGDVLHLTWYPWQHKPADVVISQDNSALSFISNTCARVSFAKSNFLIPVSTINGFNSSLPPEDHAEPISKSVATSSNDLTSLQCSVAGKGSCTSVLEHEQDAGNPVAKNSTLQDITEGRHLLDVASAEQLNNVQNFIDVLGKAVRVRVSNQLLYCDKCLKEHINSTASCSSAFCDLKITCGHARVAILYSGGIDSLMIAALADRYVPQEEPIDLLNVAFEQPSRSEVSSRRKKEKSKNEDTKDPYMVPDRVTGLSGLEELQGLNPSRNWNFIHINVPIEELKYMRDSHIRHLVYPLETVLDDSIGCALWFAAKGKGVMVDSKGTKSPFQSTARVLLVGMGADEQLGGYTRHRNAFRSKGWLGLVEELQMEINRISERNLGRDDRIITDHGRESRFPFLDENVVSFLNSLPIQSKVDLRLQRGFGEKLLLRQSAAKLGLYKTAVLPKRAIQFGSRIAKAEDGKEKASDVCPRLKIMNNIEKSS